MTKPAFADHGIPVSRLNAVVGVVVLSLVSIGLKLHGAFTHPIWADELFQREFTLRSTWLEFLSWTHDSPFYDWPPLSFMIMRLLVPLSGAGAETTWRVPGVLAAVLCVPLIYRLARNFGAPRLAGLAAAGLCACDLNLNYSAQVARGYPYQLFFLLLGFTLCTDKVINHRAAWIAGSLAFVGALWSNLLSFVFLAGVWFAVVVQIYFQSRKSKAPFLSAAMWTHLSAFIFVGGMAAWGWLCWRVRQRILALSPLLVSATLALLANAAFFLIYRLAGDLRQSVQISGAPPSWGEAMNRIRWCGLITWIPRPYLNPTVWALAIFALAWRSSRHCTSASMILGGGLAVVLNLLYAVWCHEFLEPRYLLGAAMMLWFGTAAVGQFLLQTKVSNAFLVFCGLSVLLFQGWRSVHNEHIMAPSATIEP